MSPRAMNRCKKVFGADANVWRPERWLEDEEHAKYLDSMLCTFGYGSRTCIGKNVALVEVNKYVAQFVRQFDAEYLNASHPYKLRTVWFCNQEDVPIKLRLRDQNLSAPSSQQEA